MNERLDPCLSRETRPSVPSSALGKNVAGRAHEKLDCFAAIGKSRTK